MFQISQSELTRAIARLNQNYAMALPVKMHEKLILKFFPERTWTEEQWVDAPIRTAQPLKSYYYPPTQKVAQYPDTQGEGEKFKPLVIVGPKACDLTALRIIDKVYQDTEFPDPYYVKARKEHIIISTDCSEAGDYCYCTLMNCRPYPESDFDLNLSRMDDRYLIEIGSDRGGKILTEFFDGAEKATPHMTKKLQNQRKKLTNEIESNNDEFKYFQTHQQAIQKHLESTEWADLSKTCVECGICTQICPTCHCFLLYDQPMEDTYERIKVWDSCFFAGYSRMAGGLTPRLKLADRFKNRFYHKFDSYVTNFGVEACTGCGRCVEGCMGNIDLRKVLLELEKRVVLKEEPELEG